MEAIRPLLERLATVGNTKRTAVRSSYREVFGDRLLETSSGLFIVGILSLLFLDQGVRIHLLDESS